MWECRVVSNNIEDSLGKLGEVTRFGHDDISGLGGVREDRATRTQGRCNGRGTIRLVPLTLDIG